MLSIKWRKKLHIGIPEIEDTEGGVAWLSCDTIFINSYEVNDSGYKPVLLLDR
jgi:hypothetical protein